MTVEEHEPQEEASVGTSDVDEEGALPMSPPEVVELSEACVRFVHKALGVELDYTADTLPLLDHYLRSNREQLLAQPTSYALVARAAGAYLGEVVRGRYRSFWQVPNEDPLTWQIQLETVYLSMFPVSAAQDAITFGDEGGASSMFELEDEDRELLESRLSQLPQVTEDEFYSLSTRIEILDIAVSSIKARMVDNGLGEVAFAPFDYLEES